VFVRASFGAAVALMPVRELAGAGFFVVAALFFGVAGFEFGEGALGAGDAVGSLLGGGYPGPVVLGARCPFRFAGGLLADVGEVGLRGVGRRARPDAAHCVGAGFGDVGEVVFVGDLAVLVFDGLLGSVGG
jgi:hypothetical protein